jgi:hypothetical protein
MTPPGTSDLPRPATTTTAPCSSTPACPSCGAAPPSTPLRALGNLAGMSVRAVAKEVRLSYVKVVEFQRRGSVHLHALVRLDA